MTFLDLAEAVRDAHSRASRRVAFCREMFGMRRSMNDELGARLWGSRAHEAERARDELTPMLAALARIDAALAPTDADARGGAK